MSRPTIHGHLEKLVEHELVRQTASSTGPRASASYQTNPQRVFVLLEELRRLSERYAGRGPEGDETEDLLETSEARQASGPRLVLVHGVYEGRAYPLDGAISTEGAWRIGRRKQHAVSLDYDPYVSLDNAEIRREGDGFAIIDLPASRNGTRVNWRRIPNDKPRPLRAADVIGVGRSLLVFVPG